MANITAKQFLIFFGITSAVIILFIVGANVFLKWAVNVETPREEKTLEEIPTGRTLITPVKEPDLTPALIYENGEFKPKRILRDGSGSIGCIVVLVNRSSRGLRVGISPHNAAGDPGPDYGVVAPRDKLIFDPRFPGFVELTYHNHENLKEEFTVELGPKCQ